MVLSILYRFKKKGSCIYHFQYFFINFYYYYYIHFHQFYIWTTVNLFIQFCLCEVLIVVMRDLLINGLSPPVICLQLSIKYPEAVLFTVEKVCRVTALFLNLETGHLWLLAVFLEMITSNGQHRED